MSSNASDFSLVVKTLINDDDLKALMNIPVADRQNYGLLVNKYFLQTYVSDKFTNDSVCRLLIRSGIQMETRNEFVKWNVVVIESYVPKIIDLMTGFETRTNQIDRQIQTLLNRQVINDKKLTFTSSYEMISNSNYYKRQVCRYQYKQIYK